MRKLAAVLALISGPACGGESEHGATKGGERSGGEGGAAGAEARAGGSYIPTDPNVPAAGDGRLEGGSFEGSLGSGWDFCRSKHPGATHTQGSDRSSDGAAWLAFDSQKSCADSFACAADGHDLQASFWLPSPLPPGQQLHLYFDAINLGPASPSGVLHVDATEDYCTSAATLATIPLRDLELTSDWSTRCVSFTASSSLAILGLYVTGESFQMGLDAFRFGPPCRD
jgi:hypothetical protein